MEESSSSIQSTTNQNPTNRINKPRIRKPRNLATSNNDDSTPGNQASSSSSSIQIDGGLGSNGSNNRGRGNRGRGGEGRGRIRRGNNYGGRGGSLVNGGAEGSRTNGSITPQLNGSEVNSVENGTSSTMENSSSSASSLNNLIPSSINSISNNELHSQPISRSNSNQNQLSNRQPRNQNQNNNNNNQNKNNNNNNNNQNGSSSSSSRRSRFNPSLTSGLPLTASAPSFHPPTSHSHSHLAPIVPSPVTETLISRLTKELSNGTYDCSICFSSLTKSTSIESCEICFTSFHLNCLTKWASRSLSESNERLAIRNELDINGGGGTWSCPGCQTRKKEVPKGYYCFCKRVKDPQLRLPIMPHSCGLQCGKSRPIGCGHGCGLLCHPGPCPPCSVVLTLPCHCNKVQLPIRCSSIYTSLLSPTTISSVNTTSSLQTNSTSELLSCKQSCSKLLSCELHLCKLQCHEGPCSPCDEIREKKCFCGKELKEENCGSVGSEGRIICYRPGGNFDNMWEGEWSCDKVCDAPYDCNEHFCPQSCHPHSTPISQTCPRSPTILTTCPCTSTPLNLLLASPRKSCLDPIPLCSQRCPKLLECGHTCRLPCHTGNCGPCSTEISIICRCGNLKTLKKCSERFSKDGSGNLIELVCEKICRGMRNCGRHECLERCCPLAWQESVRSKFKGKKRFELNELESDPLGIHTCQRICGRKLNCGSGHLCSMKDHKGPCPPCLNAGFDELVCHCGSTILLPPIPCGVSIHCLHPCARYGTCGHPPTPHACHEEPDCPPCPFLTEKQCACGKKKIGNVRCSQDAKKVNCGLVCGKLLRCGFHTCKKSCHLPGECEACEQVCLKPRRLCNDPCPLNCHAPSPCSIDLPCPMTIEVTCSCGFIKQKAKCAVCESRPEGNRERLVKCTDACVVFRRNAALAEALGIEKKEPKVKEVEYDPIIMSFYANNINWCTAMEASLVEFVRGDKPALHLPIMKHPQRQFTHELAELFDLRSESLDEEPRRSVIVHRQSNSGIPTPTLVEAASKRSTANVLTFTSLRKPIAERTPNNALLLEGVLGYDEEMLRDILRPLLRGLVFGVRWISDVDVLITFEPATTDLESKVTIVQRSLATLVLDTGFCSTVEGVYSGVEGAIKRGNWTPVGNSSRTPLARTAPIYSTNAFAALGDGNPTKPIARAPSSVPVYKPPHLSKSEASAIEDRYTAPESIVVPETEEGKIDETPESWDEDQIEEVTL